MQAAPEDFSLFLQQLSRAGLDLDKEQVAALQRYVELLFIWNRKTQLISAADCAVVWQRHVAESVAVSLAYDFSETGSVLDLGSGGGFPGIPLAVLMPHNRFTLVDARRKKTLFLKKVVAELGLSHVSVIHGRVEELPPSHDGEYDVVVARAVAELHELWRWSAALLKPEGKLLAMKGGQLSGEKTRLLEAYQVEVDERVYPLDLVPAEKKRVLLIVRKKG